MEEVPEAPPFWLQSSDALRRADRHRRLSSSPFLNSGFLLCLLLATAVLFIFFIVPTFLSFTAQIFRPNLVKKSWDSLNLVLVLFAIICGFLSRGSYENKSSGEDRFGSNVSRQLQRSNSSTPRQWHDQYSDRTVYNSIGTSRGRLRRSGSSYPDLRQESWWVGGDDQWRFFDDSQLKNYRVESPDRLHPRWRKHEVDAGQDSDAKNIREDTSASRPEEVSVTAPPQSLPPSPPPPTTPPPPPPSLTSSPPTLPPPPSAVEQKAKAKRTFQALEREERSENLQPPPPRPLPPASPLINPEQKRGRNDRKRGSPSLTKDFLFSLYHPKRKRKKQRQKSIENFESLLQPPSSLPSEPQPPPPPPSPPPPLSMFHTLFPTKKGKTERIHSVPPPPPPPPLPKIKTRIALAQSHPNPPTPRSPPAPVRTASSNSADDNASTGNESPVIPIPPPPPPPPFRVPDWKFAVQGDYVRLLSNDSSRSGSPDPDQGKTSPNKESKSTPAVGPDVAGDAMTDLFCPSPDVDTKADSFIARFREGLRLEKMNSMKETQRLGMSSLGRRPNSGPETWQSP